MFYIVYIFLFILGSGALFSEPARRIETLLSIGDAEEALLELQPLLAKDPDNQMLQKLEVMSLAKRGDITALLKAYSRYRDLSPILDKQLLEDVAWAVIHKASCSNSPFIRQEAFISCFMTNDAKGIPLCHKAMNDPSEQIRLLATLMAARSHDELLQEQAHKALQDAKSPRVRLQSINTVGAMRLTAAKKTLLMLLEEKNVDDAEKTAAITALASITNEIDETLIQKLIKSERASLRILASMLVLNHFDKEHALDLVLLVNDSVFDVRLSAIECIGALGIKPPDHVMEELLAHQDIKTKILANWLAIVTGYKVAKAEDNFREFLLLQDRPSRLFAAGALSHAGCRIAHFSDIFMQQNDPLVLLNLAIACIWQRHDVKRACSHIANALKDKTRLSWENMGVISYVVPSSTTHSGVSPRAPESEDLLLRLELYSMLATCPDFPIHEALKTFLKDRTWGISGQSACLMMQEGLIYFDDLRALLTDPNPEIPLQAAFILALYAQDEIALKVLINAFDSAPRHMKEYILFAVASIGSKTALPFLLKVLNEPFESLRVNAARGILICLYK